MFENLLIPIMWLILYIFCIFFCIKIFSMIKKSSSSFSDIENADIHLLKITFIILVIMSLVFFLEFIVGNNPFQKVVIAPLGEEPIKLLVGFMFTQLLLIKQIRKGDKIFFLQSFKDSYIVTSAIIAIILIGLPESIYYGNMLNILGHFSFTVIGCVLIIIWFSKIKYPYKSFGILWIFASVLLHSISNQYANITSVTVNNNYLVYIAVFLQNHTFLSNQAIYTVVVTGFALFFFILFLISNYVSKRKIGAFHE